MKPSTTVTKLKGGSLSGTYLHKKGRHSFVRKEVSLTENREFGFYRWFSQLKKVQSLEHRFPKLFPKVLDIRVKGDKAFFDMECIPRSLNGFEFLKKNPSRAEVDIFLSKLIEAMDTLHSVKIPSFKGGLDLYIDQEVRRAVEFCREDPTFRTFLKHKTIVFNGSKTKSLIPNLEKFYALARKHHTKAGECLTHGNITLENILYVPKEQRVVFIDLYHENFIDTVYNEYSQILQSSDSYYEVYNSDEARAVLKGNSVHIVVPRLPAVDYFNKRFHEFLRKRLSPNEFIITKLYQVSQFTRMLPFKKTVAPEKMIFFYALASHLFQSIEE